VKFGEKQGLPASIMENSDVLLSAKRLIGTSQPEINWSTV
jgi:hypothetical protein